jgi:hypothetical protein
MKSVVSLPVVRRRNADPTFDLAYIASPFLVHDADRVFWLAADALMAKVARWEICFVYNYATPAEVGAVCERLQRWRGELRAD